MSIPNILNKIKGKAGIDKTTIMFLSIIVGVGISSFGLGRLSVDNDTKIKDDIVISNKANTIDNKSIDNASTESDLSQQPVQSGEKRYVASKNGKMYYSPSCSGAKRIKPENEVWFSTIEDAEKSGYTKATSCK